MNPFSSLKHLYIYKPMNRGSLRQETGIRFVGFWMLSETANVQRFVSSSAAQLHLQPAAQSVKESLS